MTTRMGMVAIALAIGLAGCDPAYVAPNSVVVSPPATAAVFAMPAVVPAATGPVAVMTRSGEIMTGQASTTASGGFFLASNARLQCRGSYDPSPALQTLSIAAQCSDGRSGIGTAVRETPTSGRGTIRMNDGTEAIFIFGAPAAALVPTNR
jgi:hypothetical protein